MPQEIEISPLDKVRAIIAGQELLTGNIISLPETITLHSWVTRQEKREGKGRDPISNKLHDIITAIHAHLFKNTDGYDGEITTSATAGKIWQSDVALRYRCLDKVGARLYDRQGNLIKQQDEELSQLLAETHQAIVQDKPFAYGNNEVSAMFCILIAKAVTESQEKLDFSRLTHADQQILIGSPDLIYPKDSVDLRTLKNVFRRAMTPTEALKEEIPKEWRSIKDDGSYTEPDSEGVYHKVRRNEKDYLLAEGGGLVPLDEINQWRVGGRCIDTYTIDRKNIQFYVSEELHNKTIDNLPLTDTVKLFRSDLDHMTGLTNKELIVLDGVLERAKKASTELTRQLKDYADIPDCKALLDTVTKNEPEYDLLQKAYNRLQYVAPALLENIHKITSTVSPVDHPEYIFTIGGPGSGKGKFLALAAQKTGSNHIIASLDDARTYSKTWPYGAGHGKDYPHLMKWGSIFRERMMDAAYEEKKHLIRDCSGAPYEREEKLVARAKTDGRTVTALASTTTIEEALKRAYYRLRNEDGTIKKDGRGVTSDILNDKHIKVSREFERYLKNGNIDTLELYDNNGDKAVKIGETMEVNSAELSRLRMERRSGTLSLPHQAANMNGYPESSFLTLPKRENEGNQRRIFVYNKQEFSKFIDKGFANQRATSPKELWVNIPHHIPVPDHKMPTPFASGKEINLSCTPLDHRTGKSMDFRKALLQEASLYSLQQR